MKTLRSLSHSLFLVLASTRNRLVRLITRPRCRRLAENTLNVDGRVVHGVLLGIKPDTVYLCATLLDVGLLVECLLLPSLLVAVAVLAAFTDPAL